MDGRGRPREYQVRRGRLSASGTGRGERDQGKRLRGFRRRLHYTVGTSSVQPASLGKHWYPETLLSADR